MENKYKLIAGLGMIGVAGYLLFKKNKSNFVNASGRPCWSMSPVIYSNGYCRPRELTIAWYMKQTGDKDVDFCTIGSERAQSALVNSPGYTVPIGVRPQPFNLNVYPLGNKDLCGCPSGVAPTTTFKKATAIVTSNPINKVCR